MSVAAALDIHKRVVQAVSLDEESGETREARFGADRGSLKAWVGSFGGRLGRVAVEATCGWRWVCEELELLGVEVVLVDPAEASARKGKRRKPKTDRLDARFLLGLLVAGMAPLSYRAPRELQELRDQTRLRKALQEDENAWANRVHAILVQEGWPCEPGSLLSDRGLLWVRSLALPESARAYIERCLEVLAAIGEQRRQLEQQLRAFAKADGRCRALMGLFGIGPTIAATLVAEIGTTRRFKRPRSLVRAAGIDPVVEDSAETKRRGKISKAGSPHLRWALTQAAQYATMAASPDHRRYQRVLARRNNKNAAKLTVARVIARRVYHTLKAFETSQTSA